MFGGLHGHDVIVRLPEDARATLLAMPGAHVFEPMVGRPMREYIVPPAAIVADLPTLRDWLDQAFRYCASLPPKVKEKPAAGKTKKATKPRA